ncbi:MAG: hypothetical protein ACR2HM_04840 [Acidimicrobiales bacterium]
MRQSRTTALVLSGVLALGLAACGDDNDEASTTTTVPVTQPAPVGSPTVSIDMLENSFVVSGPLTAGGTLKIANKGTELHMVLIEPFKAGKTLTDLQQVLSRLAQTGGPTTTVAGATTTSTVRGATTTTVAGGRNENPLADVLEDTGGFPGAVMSPGESAEVQVPTLAAGTYALICFIPGEGDGVPHFVEGMVGQLEVLPGAAPAVPTADATYLVTKGKAVEGPATLTAGRHTIKVEVAAGGNELEPVLVRLNARTTFAALDAAVTKVFESDTPPAAGTAAKLPGQIVYGGLDLGTVTTFYLTVDLKAGNYALVAEDSDVEPKPRTREIINIKVS